METEGTTSQAPTEMVVRGESVEAGEQEEGIKEKKKMTTLADDVASRATVHRDGKHPGLIGPLQNWRLKYAMDLISNEAMIHLGLVSSRGKRQETRGIKVEHLHSLARRHGQEDTADFTRRALLRFKSREAEVRLQHNPEVMEQHDGADVDYDVMEELLLDAGFILERLLQHWEASCRPTVVMRPTRYRSDLVLFSNQIPYLLLQELMQMVKLPATTADSESSGQEYFLRSIAIGYMVGEQASGWVLTKYTGPVYHLLHLVYLHLASAVDVEEPSPSLRRSLCNSGCKCKAFFSGAARSAKKALRRRRAPEAGHALLRTVWWSYRMVPPARELCRVGIRLRPRKGTRCPAAVCFRDGVLELPCVELEEFDSELLINLMALELEWEIIPCLFISYAVFMGELMTNHADMNLLLSADILSLTTKAEPGPSELLIFRLLANLNSGRELHHHFVQLARQIKDSYDKLNNHTSPCAGFSCLST